MKIYEANAKYRITTPYMTYTVAGHAVYTAIGRIIESDCEILSITKIEED